MADILKFPRKMHELLKLSESLWIHLLNDTPMAHEQADRLIAEFEECKKIIREGGSL